MSQGADSPHALHPQLVADCHVLGHCEGLALLLHRNARLPWFILVPPDDALELYELPMPLRANLDAVADRLARFVKGHFASDKINVAALGNLVPQLHLHVIGRRRDDACWPRPVWGHLNETAAYAPAALTTLVEALRAADCLDD